MKFSHRTTASAVGWLVVVIFAWYLGRGERGDGCAVAGSMAVSALFGWYARKASETW